MTPGNIHSPSYNFADFALERDSLRLFRQGEDTDLPPLSGKLLRALITRAPGTLTYEEIASEVWGGRHVSRSTITQRVKLLRRSLGDHAEEPIYIALVRGSGYRFIPPVEIVAGKGSPARGWFQPPWMRPALVTACLVIALAVILIPGRQALVNPDASGPDIQLAVPIQAQQMFELGKVLYHRRAPGDLDQAREHFLNAIALAPEYPEPWVLLAGIYRIMAMDGVITLEDARRLQQDALTQALSLQPGLVAAKVRQAELDWLVTGETETMNRRIDEALALEPLHPLALEKKGELLQMRGDWQAALAVRERAAAQHPASLVFQGNLATQYMLIGRLKSAEDTLMRILDIHPQQGPELAVSFAYLRLLQARPDAALEWTAKIRDERQRWSLEAMAHHIAGRLQQVQETLDLLRADTSPLSLAKAVEIEHFTGKGKAIEDQVHRIISMAADDPRQIADVQLALEELLHSPFMGWPESPELWGKLSRDIRATNKRVAAIGVPICG